MNPGEQRCPKCHGIMRLVMQEQTYNKRAKRKRHECYECKHRSTSYAVSDEFFQQLIAAHDIVQRLQGFYFDHCDPLEDD
jgi:transcriptional regulator NrdR family protein